MHMYHISYIFITSINENQQIEPYMCVLYVHKIHKT